MQCTVNCNKNLLFDLDGESRAESTSTHTHFSSILFRYYLSIDHASGPTFVAVFIYPGRMDEDSVPILAEGSYVVAVARDGGDGDGVMAYGSAEWPVF